RSNRGWAQFKRRRNLTSLAVSAKYLLGGENSGHGDGVIDFTAQDFRYCFIQVHPGEIHVCFFVAKSLGAFHCCEARSEEHTSELQSRFDLVCRLLLEKKKQQ